MFWTKEDIRPAVDLTKKLVGNSNVYLTELDSIPNVHIMTREYGKLWYGDISVTDELKNKLEMLSVTINQRVFLFDDKSTILYTTISKLQEISPENYNTSYLC